MGDMVIVAYRPEPGKAEALVALVKDHAPFLRRLGLATDRPALVMQAKDDVVVEAFERVDGASAIAHHNPDVLALWTQFEAACDYIPLHQLPEAQGLFAQFIPIEL